MSATAGRFLKDDADENIISRLWQGKVSLAVTFWVYAVIGNAVAAPIIKALVVTVPGTRPVLLVLATIYSVFVIVALWRSSERYQGPLIWFYLVRLYSAASVVFVVIFLIAGISHIAQQPNSSVPQYSMSSYTEPVASTDAGGLDLAGWHQTINNQQPLLPVYISDYITMTAIKMEGYTITEDFFSKASLRQNAAWFSAYYGRMLDGNCADAALRADFRKGLKERIYFSDAEQTRSSYFDFSEYDCMRNGR